MVAYGKDFSKNNFSLARRLSAVAKRRKLPAAPESQALVPSPFRPRSDENVHVNKPPLYAAPNAAQPSPLDATSQQSSLSNLSDSLTTVSESNSSLIVNVPHPPVNEEVTHLPFTAVEVKHPSATNAPISHANEVIRPPKQLVCPTGTVHCQQI